MTNTVKILLGRQLTKEQIEASKKGIAEPISRFFSPEKYKGNIDNIFQEENKIKRNRAKYECVATNELPGNWYLIRLDKREYEKDGRLTRKEVETCEPNGMRLSHIITSYDPPGKFIGKHVYNQFT